MYVCLHTCIYIDMSSDTRNDGPPWEPTSEWVYSHASTTMETSEGYDDMCLLYTIYMCPHTPIYSQASTTREGTTIYVLSTVY